MNDHIENMFTYWFSRIGDFWELTRGRDGVGPL